MLSRPLRPGQTAETPKGRESMPLADIVLGLALERSGRKATRENWTGDQRGVKWEAID